MKFVVGERTFDRESDAKVELTSLLEQKLQSFETVQYTVDGEAMHCPTHAQQAADEKNTKVAYRVGGFDFADEKQAEKVVTLVKDAVANVGMTYKVDGKTYHCSKTAGSKCKKNGAKMTYVVGDEETPCDVSAKLLLTEAKLRTVVETAAGVFASS